MYVPKYLKLYEVLPKEFYNRMNYRGNKLWVMFNVRVLITADQLRERYGRITANDYKYGGNNQYRGWRPFNCGVGALLSQHKFARALDCIFKNCTAEEIRVDILKKPDLFPFITCIEAGVSWLHFDVRNHDRVEKGIKIIHP